MNQQKKPNDILEAYFAKEHPGYFKSPSGVENKVIRGLACRQTMKNIPDNYYDHVMAAGVLGCIPTIDMKTGVLGIDILKEIVQETVRILKPGMIFTATVMVDNEVGDLGYNYGCLTLAISKEKFWAKLQKELGYTILSIDSMGMWKNHGNQKSRYAIQIRKNESPGTGVPTDLKEAKKVSKPTAIKEVSTYITVASVLAVVFLAATIWIYLKFMRKVNVDSNESSTVEVEIK